MFQIPLFNLNYNTQEEQAVLTTIRSKWISTGPKCQELEELFADMLKAKFAVAVTNCTAALHLAMRILEISKGDEVICPSLTFVATANAIRYVGAVPVFADIKSFKDLTIDPDDIERKITKKTKAIMVMHYGGFACDMDAITRIAKEHNLKVIEDACHGPMAEYRGKKLGTIGDIGCFSFFSNKNISTGEGGMFVTDNHEFFEKTKLLRSHGMTTLSYERSKGHATSYDVVDLGYNYRMDDIRASIAIVQLNKLEEDLVKRQKVRKYYEQAFMSLNNIIVPFSTYSEFASNYIFPIVLKDSDFTMRDRVRNQLAEKGIETSVHYPAVHRFSIYKEFYTELPKTDYVTDNLITIPMFGNLSEKNVEYIRECLSRVLNE